MFAAEVVQESLPGNKEKIEQNGIHKNVEGIQIATGQDINSDIHSRLQDRDRNAKIPPHPRILREKGKEIQGFRRVVAKIKTRSTGRALAPEAALLPALTGEEAKERRRAAQKEMRFFMKGNLRCAADSAISVWSAARKDRQRGNQKKIGLPGGCVTQSSRCITRMTAILEKMAWRKVFRGEGGRWAGEQATQSRAPSGMIWSRDPNKRKRKKKIGSANRPDAK
ncbi:hypothetical protein H8693_05440 [Christensenellaceae bacterium NSJ-63]|uniref:Uncharacterized protein n=1 Tax=Guopingia tenuis TaxID=2763656 RepID=A0A926DG97_9FIRM|nr:hypothetical protein [Guopingia tenuis]MBC8538375.1 hypothetical protein [Guopingia tenuis]